MRRRAALAGGLVAAVAMAAVGTALLRGAQHQLDDVSVAPAAPVVDGSPSPRDAPVGSGTTAASGPLRLVLDPTLQPPVEALPGGGRGEPRPVVAVTGPGGETMAFVADELVVRVAGDLATFAADRGAEVLDAGVPLVADPRAEPADVADGLRGWALLRLPPGRPDLDAAARALDAAGWQGTWRLSAVEATTALVAAVELDRASPNLLGELPGVPEHPGADGVPRDASQEWYLREDGLGAGIVRAWEYVKYTGHPAAGVSVAPVTLAHLDTGFDLDEQTGLPTEISGGDDYGPVRPDQLDEVAGDTTAGGHGAGFSNCNDPDCWHAQLYWAVGAGVARNGFGVAGTSGGREVRPLLVKINADLWTVARGVRDALVNHADVLTVNYARPCDWGCRYFEDGDALVSAVAAAVDVGAVVVAAAGNHGRDISASHVVPCAVEGVICVGGGTQGGEVAFASNDDGTRERLSNWGTPVDIWAPWTVRAGPTRVTAARHAADPAVDAVVDARGTCASAPFVAGVAALLRMLDPDLTSDDVRSVLQATAKHGDDPLVGGMVDAFAAVRAVHANQPPRVTITTPSDGADSGLDGTVVRVDVADPERPSPFWGPASFVSRLDVLVQGIDDEYRCSDDGDVTTPAGGALSCEVTGLAEGVHTLLARVTDPFGAQTSDTVTVHVRNTVPVARITRPADGAVVTAGVPVALRGLGFDPDEELSGAALVWRSDLAGHLGTGASLEVSLPPGTHTITLTAVDRLGATGQALVRVVAVDPAGRPQIAVLEPADGTSVTAGTAVTLVARATDPEDGELGDDAITWTSDVDGDLGSGGRLVWTPSGSACGITEHTVTAIATDAHGNTASAVIALRVGTIC